MAPDISQLKAELKAWERAFKSEHNREPSKDDMKRVPEMGERGEVQIVQIPSEEARRHFGIGEVVFDDKVKGQTCHRHHDVYGPHEAPAAYDAPQVGCKV
ncbi:hypothetical protein BOTBODRAFT_583216 [Botryobasidium botryosum FD-172 SS1]|uniref:Uncharacterized protein n=1 Tax=Botryobasidium botryosum (strain FD-172 SS1) TaxID=930990 RepID=A0A067N1Z1_BOTB1|nr:hypothetical protein BOTBODRAFT_583216 [Botryobasidium botryosum FD-172 SS1]